MKISLVAALDRARGIGLDNQMPWHLPDDFKQFKAYTLGKPVIMGRKTAQSLGRALPGRRNLVLTHQGTVPFDGMEAVSSLQQAYELAREDGAPEVCVIGGAQVFALALEDATDLHLTWVNAQVPADTFFPSIDYAQWRPNDLTSHPADARHAYSFQVAHYLRAVPHTV
jgi:dihydrofolate reductase